MKKVEEFYTEMMTDFSTRTGMEVSAGGDISARLYAAAAQLYALYAQADWVNRQCFPQTAQGEYLDHHAQLRALERKQAACAAGQVRFFGDGAGQTDQIIPAGTVCMTPGLVRFITTQEGVLPAGESHVDLSVQAVQAGSAGNVIAGSVRLLAAAPVGITGCTNPQAMTGGTDAEEDEQLRQRILNSFARLPNGANAAFYEQTAMSVEEVVAAAVLPRNRGVGTVDVIISTVGGVPGQKLLDEVAERLQDCREIAVDVKVCAPETVQVDIAVQISAQDEEQACTAVRQALVDHFTGKLLGQDVLRARLGSLIYGLEDVENCVLTEPAQDIAIEKNQLPVLGTVHVEMMA